jgi:lipoic acid synthetase
MSERDHNPSGRRLHLPIAGVTNGPGVNTTGVRKPPWLKVRLASGPNYMALKSLVRDADLHTVCEEAMCPNIGECWEEREATFLILGMRSRRCSFCDVMTCRRSIPRNARIAVRWLMGLRYVV